MGKIKKRWLDRSWRHRNRTTIKYSVFKTSFKCSQMITRIYRILLGEEDLPTSERSIFYNNESYTDKVYNKAIDDMIQKIKTDNYGPEGSPDDNKGNIKTTDNTTDDIKKANPKNNTSTAEEINNQKKNKNKGSGPDWSTAPAVGSKARATWYKKHNLALDRTTPGGPKK
jgi:hypothetical protein